MKIKLNDTFSNLTVIEMLGSITFNSGTKRKCYKCKCKCGNVLTATGTDLRTKRKISCKECSFRNRELRKKPVPQLEQMYNHDIILRCKHGNINNNLSFEDFKLLVKQNCHYCNDEPSLVPKFKRNKYINTEDLYTNGIDRIDSNLGYSKDNCVPCCSSCNKMKLDMSYDLFKEKIMKIFKNLKLSQ